MEPIPLRALTVLLNRERMLSDPRFKNMGLVRTSIADPGMNERMRANYPNMIESQPETVDWHMFQIFTQSDAADQQNSSTTCFVHSDAAAEVCSLSGDTLQLIYEETRGHDGCYKAVGLYQFFFELCPSGQQLSIQIADEKPILVDVSSMISMEFKIDGPRHAVIATMPETPRVLWTGITEGEMHSVIGFPRPDNPKELIIVDMSRMQYGAAGRGAHGESYFIGSYDSYVLSMSRVCHHLEFVRFYNLSPIGEDINGTDARLRACASTVWDRWQNRGVQGWCEWCGKGGRDLLMCGGCKKVRYCSKAHQKHGWKLHKLTCDSKKST